MKEKTEFLYKALEDKTITWSESSNQYLILENTTALIFKKLNAGVFIKEIASELSKELSLPIDKTTDFVTDLEQEINALKIEKDASTINKDNTINKPEKFEFIKYYKINELIFKVEFYSEYELYLVHPKFEHLEIEDKNIYAHTFTIFCEADFIYFYIENNFIGTWNKNEIHFFQGKFSMEIIQAMHQKTEDNWMGVFHASAVGNSEKSVLFLGDSGNGKSTSLAILQANGFGCVADDFVPIDLKKQEVYSFPAAISIKKNSLGTLLPIYPELATTAEYNFKRLRKIVRYLKPNNTEFTQHLPCNELVFIKYEKDADIQFSKIDKIAAFSQLIPDSWISPKKENAQVFLDWFTSLDCYQLTYSNNDEMIQTVSNLFNNDL